MGWNGEETEKWFVARINRVKKLIWRSKEECITQYLKLNLLLVKEVFAMLVLYNLPEK